MQDTLLLCQIRIDRVLLQGYRVGLQYLIVAEGLRDGPLRYIFNDFEEMNQLWLDLKASTETQLVQKLTSREQGLQRVSKPKPRPAGSSAMSVNPSARPRPTESWDRPAPPRPKPRG